MRNMNPGRPENNYSECLPQRAITSSDQENYYSALSRGTGFLDVTALTMSTSSLWKGSKDNFEPMYIDVVTERPPKRKSSRRLKCLIVWLVFLSVMSLTSLAFTTVIFYNVGMFNGSDIFFRDQKEGEFFGGFFWIYAINGKDKAFNYG